MMRLTPKNLTYIVTDPTTGCEVTVSAVSRARARTIAAQMLATMGRGLVIKSRGAEPEVNDTPSPLLDINDVPPVSAPQWRDWARPIVFGAPGTFADLHAVCTALGMKDHKSLNCVVWAEMAGLIYWDSGMRRYERSELGDVYLQQHVSGGLCGCDWCLRRVAA